MKHARLIVLGCLLTIAGCGDDGGENGLDPNKQVNTLSQPELDSLCMGTLGDAESLGTEEEFCTALGVFTTGLAGGTTQQCEMLAQTCLQEDGTDAGAGGGMQEPACFTMADVAECQATVGEVQSCFDAQFAKVRSLLSQASCDDPAASYQTISPIAEPEPECEPVSTKCEALIGELEGMLTEM